ncbi:hypothetical protein C8R43DRAFT_695974 [Mycena crocata]|nr:hypothetical protein C8R43DRAFT_695974 [Mycena crocata]
MFSNILETSPFASYSVSSSTILLVNKVWRRAGTPFLYNVIILRSIAQAAALAAVLKGDENLGKFVKKLRVEGGFGSHMQHILERTPNVVDLFLSAMIYATDSASGLVLGLPLLNPTRVTLFEQRRLKNNGVTQLFSVLADGISNWTKLTTVSLSRPPAGDSSRNKLRNAICSSTSLTTLSILFSTKDDFLPFLNEVANIPSLLAIDLRPSWTPDDIHLYGDYVFHTSRAHPKLKSVIKIHRRRADAQVPQPTTVPAVPASLPRADAPMVSAPQSVADLIWTRILFFAMVPADIDPNPYMYEHIAEKANRTRRNLIFVSRTITRLAVPYLYGYPLLSSERMVQRFSDGLKAAPFLGLFVREIRVHTSLADRVQRDRQPGPSPNLSPIFACTPALTRLSGRDRKPIRMSREEFELLARTAGSSLVEFTGYCVAGRLPYPEIFNHFTALRWLGWAADQCFIAPIHPAALPNLSRLDVASMGMLPAFFQTAPPRLRHLVLGPDVFDFMPFIRQHGAKITTLETHHLSRETFLFCPALTHLTLAGTWGEKALVTTELLSFPERHLSLTKLVITKELRWCRSKTATLEIWRRFFASAQYIDFPALREIQVSCYDFNWPTTEHAISKSLWVRSERLLEYNIRLTDRAGVHWRPRL